MKNPKLSFLPLALAVGLVGCGGPGGSVMNKKDQKALLRPPEAEEGYGDLAEEKRTWAPVAEALYQRILAESPEKDRLIAISYGMSGEYMVDGLALLWKDTGPFTLIRLDLRFGNLENPGWKSTEISRPRGVALLNKFPRERLWSLESDKSLLTSVFGEGGAVFLFAQAGDLHEAQVWAPFTLVERGGSSLAKDLLVALRGL
jgi:hypothetical protein